MLRILRQAVQKGTVTNAFPRVLTERPEGFRGKPVIEYSRCGDCGACLQLETSGIQSAVLSPAGASPREVCPTGAIRVEEQAEGSGGKILALDYGQCIFCGACEEACPDAVHLTKETLLASGDRERLVQRASFTKEGDGRWHFEEVASSGPHGGMHPARVPASLEEIGGRLSEKIRNVFGRSLHIREVDAGSCNGCEIEITALNNPVYDIERFGIHFVASPRHADMLLVTGPVSRNMEVALRQTYEATPGPKLVVAAGACAIGGGIFGKSYASCGGVSGVVPVDVYIPGCPPQPEALLHGILTAVDRYPR